MALTKITLRNFKSIGGEAQTIELAPYTLLFGPNSVGKSTLIQALIFSYELLANGNRDVHKTELGGDAIDLGGFINTVHGRDPGREVTIELECSVDEDDLVHWDELSLAWRGNVPWPFFLQGRKPTTAKIEMGIAMASDGNPMVTKFASYVDDSLLSIISANKERTRVSAFSGALRGLYYNFEELGADEGPLASDWDETEQFHPVTPESSKGGDIEENFPGFMDFIQKTWVLDQEDALPHRQQSKTFFQLTQSDEDLLAYFQEEKWFDGRELNEPKLLEALSVVPAEQILRALLELLYIGPLREIPSRDSLAGLLEKKAGWWNGAEAWNLSGRGPGGIELLCINRWLGQKRLKTGYKVQISSAVEIPEDHAIWHLKSEDLDEDGLEIALKDLRSQRRRTQIALVEERNNLELSAKDVGTGISQVFPILAAAATYGCKLIAAEQPELHVHPKLQTELADVLMEAHAVLRHRFLIETHSEHLVLRFLRRIEESFLRPEDKHTQHKEPEDVTREWPDKLPAVSHEQVAIYYVTQGDSGAIFHRISVFEDGETEGWPDGFFREREEELGL